MVYATKADMLKRYEEQELIQLTDYVKPFTEAIVDSVLDQALADASATIDLYLHRYDLPLADIPPALVNMACLLAFYNLNRNRMTDEIRQDYADVMKSLESIAAGKIKLDSGGEEPKSAAAIAQVDGPNRIFNRASLKGY
ncbi:MAG: DUF1320 family protein [Alphaproteobacteria bacterium]|jgi:phage gp36-like protein|nr:DUF1320 family protein [Alphaproteobacteria bacterium]